MSENLDFIYRRMLSKHYHTKVIPLSQNNGIYTLFLEVNNVSVDGSVDFTYMNKFGFVFTPQKIIEMW